MRRALLIGLLVSVLAFATLIVIGVIVGIGVIDRQSALADHDAAANDLQTAVSDVEEAVAEVDEVLELSSDPLIPADQLAAITPDRDAASVALDEAAVLLAQDVDALDTQAVRDLTARLRAASTGLLSEDATLFSELKALVLTMQTASTTVEAANFEAENQPRIAFRHAVVDLNPAVDDELIAEQVADYLDAAHTLEASHAEEIAEKAGPLFDEKMIVEQFARSIAGGVLLDFDWGAVVNGFGTGGSYGGTSYWFSEDGGYATLTLSDSVASMWPSAGVQSLVAHEIGHAILSKCTDLFYESEFYAGEEESWATAWAIGSGYTADGSGESLYGRPSDGLIALTTQCR